jgi:hypothetical protein
MFALSHFSCSISFQIPRAVLPVFAICFRASLAYRSVILINKPEAGTEQQIGVCVYDRPPGYNPNDDNIVRSQARQLRLKLEHHFANEGKDEPIVITTWKPSIRSCWPTVSRTT